MKLSMSSKSKKKKKKKGSNWNVKVKTAVSLFFPQNYLDILLNLHMFSVLCSLGLFWPDSDQKLTQLVWNGVFGQNF